MIDMRWVYSLMLIVMMAVVTSCGKSAYSSKAQNAEFSQYKTYAWLPMQKDTTNGNVLDNDITYANLRDAANQEMKKRGYTLDVNNPDMLLVLKVEFEEETEVVQNYVNSGFYYPGYYMNPWSPYYGGFYGGYYNTYYPYDYSVYNYVKGTTVVDVIDREKNQLVWRGWSEERINDYDDVEELNEEVEKIFEEFPLDEKGRAKKK